MVLWFYVQELPKAQPAVVLVLKRLRICLYAVITKLLSIVDKIRYVRRLRF